MNDRTQVLNYMKRYGSITRIEALSEIGTINLPDKIYQLKREGYAIRTENVKVRRRNGKLVTVARYFLEENEQS